MAEEVLVDGIDDGVVGQASPQHPAIEFVTTGAAFEHQPMCTEGHEVVHQRAE